MQSSAVGTLLLGLRFDGRVTGATDKIHSS